MRGGVRKQISLRQPPRLLAVGSGQASALCAPGQKRTGAPASPRRRRGTRRAGLPCRVGPHISSSWAHPKAASAPISPQHGLALDYTGNGELATCRRPVSPLCSHPATSRLGLSGFRGSLDRHCRALVGGGGSQGHTITPNPLSEAFAAAGVFTCGWSREGAACQPCTEGWAGSWESPVPRLWRMHPAWVSMEDVRDVGSDPWVGKFPWPRKWQPTPVFLPGKFHVLCRSLKLAEPWLKNRGSASWDWFPTEPETFGVVGRPNPAGRGLRLFWIFLPLRPFG